MPKTRHLPAFLTAFLLACLMGPGSGLAKEKSLDEAANEASYSTRNVLCSGGACRALVMNNQGVGVMVKGDKKKKTEKEADAKAQELNDEAEAGTVSQEKDEVFDACARWPDLC